MMEFWFVAVLLAAIASFFVLAPLRRSGARGSDVEVRRASNLLIFEDRRAEILEQVAAQEISEDEGAALETELRRSLLRDVDDLDGSPVSGGEPATGAGARVLVGAAVLVPAFAIVLYADWGLSLGALADLELAQEVERLEAPAGTAEASGEMGDLEERLAARLAQSPDDLDGWFLLGRTRMQLENFEGAALAFAEVAERAPAVIGPRVYQAQALYLADGRIVTPRVRALVDAVLTREPEQSTMLELLAMDAFQNRRFNDAARYFGRVLAGGIEDAPRRAFLEDGLARSRELAGLPSAEPPTFNEPPPVPAADAEGPSIDVEVVLSQAARASLPAQAAVFVLARPVNGPRMPLAVERLAPADRLQVRLGVEDAMAPAMTLATVDEVELVVRLSLEGTAAAGPNDLEAVFGPLTPSAHPRVTARLDPRGSSAELAEATLSSSAPSPPSPDAGTGVSLSLLVELAPGLTPPTGSTLFVFAREVGGAPMPLAVSRLEPDSLPTLVRLDDSMAMIPGRTLSAAEAVELVARITASGGVVAQAGDLEGRSPPMDPRGVDRVVSLLIDQVVE